MDRSAGETLLSPARENPKLPFTNSLLGGIKQIIGFFVMTEDELSRAGICLGIPHQRDEDGQVNPLAGFNESDRAR